MGAFEINADRVYREISCPAITMQYFYRIPFSHFRNPKNYSLCDDLIWMLRSKYDVTPAQGRTQVAAAKNDLI